MSTVKITSIAQRSFLTDDDYKFIIDNLNKELPLMSVNYTPEGKVFSIAVYRDNTCVSLFIETNKITYELVDTNVKMLEELKRRRDVCISAAEKHKLSKLSYAGGLIDGHIEELNTLIAMLEGSA